MVLLKKGVSSPICQLSQISMPVVRIQPKEHSWNSSIKTIFTLYPKVVIMFSKDAMKSIIRSFLTFNDYNQLAYEDFFKLCLMKVWRVIRTTYSTIIMNKLDLKDLLEALKSRLIADDIYINSTRLS